MHRTSKSASSSAATIHQHDHVARTAGLNGRHKRVWKACERCRMRKTKCDGEFPCKRCKDDDLVCTVGVRKKIQYKQLPRGYIEVLENTQLALIATIHKLYSMVLKNQPWELGEAELNDRGQPVVHNIAQKLGCIRPIGNIDLPIYSVFPEDEASMAQLGRQFEDQQKENEQQKESDQQKEDEQQKDVKDTDSPVCSRTEQTLLSELEHSGLECDYQKAPCSNNAAALSPQSFTGSTSNIDLAIPPPEIYAAAMFLSQSASMPDFPAWPMAAEPQPSDLAMQFLQQPGVLGNMGLLYPGLVESEFRTINPHILSCPKRSSYYQGSNPLNFRYYK